MNYTLYNKKLNRKLIHPSVGIWFTTDLNEAKSMLTSCMEYLDSKNLSSIKSDFVVIDLETDKEVS